MVKRVLSVIMVLSLVGILGCSLTSNTTSTPPPSSVKTIREAKIGSAWEMKQLEITLGTEYSILLTLADGDKADGYFYLEKGDSINFRITGNSLIYESKAKDAKTQGVTSDRFSFVASKAQGIAYTLTLSNAAGSSDQQSKATIFLEIIYPATGSVFIPIKTN
jgi:hypothetical protein